MDERIVQARVGIVVISSLLLTAILIVLFGDFPTPFRRGKVIDITFPSAPGVMEGTPVRKSGILVGRVENVRFAEDSSDVVVKVRLNEKTELRNNEVPRINSGSLLGDAIVEFVPGDAPSTGVIEDGAELEGMAGRNPLEMITNLEGDMRDTLKSVTSAGDEVGKLAQQMNEVFEGQDEQQMKRIVDKTETALDSFNRAMTNINQIVGEGDQQNSLRKSLDDLPKVIDDTRTAMASIRRVADRADKNMQNLEGLTGPLGERGPAIVSRIDSSTAQLDEIMGQLSTFTDRINSEDGTLGQLISNRELYDNLNGAVINIQRLTTDVRPILNDVRVFSDKIARDPGRLGVRGALQRNDSGTKFPNYGCVEPPPIDWREDLAPPLDWHQGP